MERSRKKRPSGTAYANDDYAPYAGPDYREVHPGVSGKVKGEAPYVNGPELEEQRSFLGKGPKGYQRSDDRIYEDVCETLMNSHDLDATPIGVKVEHGVVVLEGKVETREEKRLAEALISDRPGVRDVRNEIQIKKSLGTEQGPESATRKDLGVGDRSSLS